MSKRSRDVFFIATIIIAIAFVIADHTALKPFRKAIIENKKRGSDGQKYHNKTFIVTNVIDGDTFDINAPDGQKEFTRIRVIGIDTPETVDPRYPKMYFGKEASKYASDKLQDKKVLLTIDTISDQRDHYGRLLCYVQTEDGTDFGKEMIRLGMAYADTRFDHSKIEKYITLQEQTIANRVGLWDKISFDQLPNWLKKENPDILENH